MIPERAEGDDVPTRHVLLSSLTSSSSLREGGVVPGHVDALAELGGDWGAIVIWSPNNVVIDGNHRVAAARKLGMDSIEARELRGSDTDAFAEAIRCNVRHGLPLTLPDRLRAAQRLLELAPDWSDRRIAALCGLACGTLGRLRSKTFQHGQGDLVRVGLDGKKRPARAGMARRRVLETLASNPNGSLREIAVIAGTSPETVRQVRNSIANNRTSDDKSVTMKLPPPSALQMRSQAARGLLHDKEAGLDSDPAIASCIGGQDLVSWLEAGRSIYEGPRYIDIVPLSRIYEVADEARRRSDLWRRFANDLERRASPRAQAAS